MQEEYTMMMARLSVNGKTTVEGRIDNTQPVLFSAAEIAHKGLDNQTLVVEVLE